MLFYTRIIQNARIFDYLRREMICAMNRYILTKEETESLEHQHLQCKDKKDSDRLKAVLLCSKGWTVPKFKCPSNHHYSLHHESGSSESPRT